MNKKTLKIYFIFLFAINLLAVNKNSQSTILKVTEPEIKRIEIPGHFRCRKKFKAYRLKGKGLPDLTTYFKEGWKIGIATNTIDGTYSGPYQLYPKLNGKVWKRKDKPLLIRYRIRGGGRGDLIFKTSDFPYNYIIFIEKPDE